MHLIKLHGPYLFHFCIPVLSTVLLWTRFLIPEWMTQKIAEEQRFVLAWQNLSWVLCFQQCSFIKLSSVEQWDPWELIHRRVALQGIIVAVSQNSLPHALLVRTATRNGLPDNWRAEVKQQHSLQLEGWCRGTKALLQFTHAVIYLQAHLLGVRPPWGLQPGL